MVLPWPPGRRAALIFILEDTGAPKGTTAGPADGCVEHQMGTASMLETTVA